MGVGKKDDLFYAPFKKSKYLSRSVPFISSRTKSIAFHQSVFLVFQSQACCVLCLSLVKYDAHALNVVHDIRIIDLVKNGQVEAVRQEQVVNFIHNTVQHVQR